LIGVRGVRSSARLILWSWGKVTCRQRQHERPARPAQAPAIAERGTHDVQRWNTRSPATRAVQLTAAEYCACCRAVLAAILVHTRTVSLCWSFKCCERAEAAISRGHSSPAAWAVGSRLRREFWTCATVVGERSRSRGQRRACQRRHRWRVEGS